MGKQRSNDLTTLGRDLQHCRDSSLAHQAWSEAVDQALRIDPRRRLAELGHDPR